MLQSVPVKPDETYLALVYVRGKLSKQAESELLIQWQDAAGKWLIKAPKRADRLPFGGSSDWNRLSTFVRVSPGACRLIFSISAYQQATDDVLQMDDASLRRQPQWQLRWRRGTLKNTDGTGSFGSEGSVPALG